ncbi:MAG: Uma2 family endonuclease [Planctomycetaceae bacterium]|nr:Uma2 family endonuclease [Planctomycetaceae bacterium]
MWLRICSSPTKRASPRKFIVPDVFVVKDCDPGLGRVEKVWDEPSPPQVVIEVTSRSSKREDAKSKPRIYRDISVLEYFLYNPTSDDLKPPLCGFHRTGGPFGHRGRTRATPRPAPAARRTGVIPAIHARGLGRE